jgi:hypothetical protein
MFIDKGSCPTPQLSATNAETAVNVQNFTSLECKNIAALEAILIKLQSVYYMGFTQAVLMNIAMFYPVTCCTMLSCFADFPP